MKIPSLKNLTAEDIEDIADLIDDAAAGVSLKDVKPEGIHTLAAKRYAEKFLHALAIEFQGRVPRETGA